MSRTFILLLSSLLWLSAAAQQQGENIELNSPIIGGQHSYMATQSIRMLPGFSYKPVAGGDFFKGGIEDYIPQEVTPLTAGTIGGPGGEVGDDGVVGGAKGNFGVNEYGQAAYNFPLEFPGGRGGMTPELNLIYNSSGGDGILGPGWSLGGLSVINVSHESRYYDGAADESIGLDYKRDAYTLDGQRLIPLSDEKSSTLEFRTENDGFRRIMRKLNSKSNQASATNVKDGDDYFFKVQTKGGLTYYYGEKNTSSKLQVNVGTNGDLVTVSYYVNKITDNFGNTINYIYDNKIGNTTANIPGQIYLEEIQYTYSAKDSKTDYQVEILYKDRNAPKLSYYLYQNLNTTTETTLLFKSEKLIDSIVCTHIDSRSIVKTFKLEYLYRGVGETDDVKKEYLNSVQEHRKDKNIEYNKTLFEWEPEMDYDAFSGESFDIVGNVSSNDIDDSILKYILIDFDNDGINEIIETWYRYISWEEDENVPYGKKELELCFDVFKRSVGQYSRIKRYFYRQTNQYLQSVPYYSFNDFNGDGFPDLFLGFYGSDGNTSTFFYKVINHEGELGPDGDSYIQNNAQFITSFNNYRIPYLADFNGDAMTDLMIQSESLGDHDLVWRLGSVDSPLVDNDDNDITFNPQSSDIKESSNLEIADYNGDGRADILRNRKIIHFITRNQNGEMIFRNYSAMSFS